MAPAEEDIAVLCVEVAKLLFRQSSELPAFQHEAFHAIQVLIPFLHQLLCLSSRPQVRSEHHAVQRPPPLTPPQASPHLSQCHGRLPR